jgi:hypothetical protein
MSWTKYFPMLEATMIASFQQKCTDAESEEYEQHFGVEETQGRRQAESGSFRHLLSISLFWKHVGAADPELPKPTRESLVDAKRMGLVKRFSPWESYIEPIFLHSPMLMERHPGVEFVCHLARDLDFLIADLVDLGWTVKLMKSSSLRYCPGGFWRFLPLEETDTIVTVIDSDRLGEAGGDIERTEAMAQMGLGLWRVPGYYHAPIDKEIRYRPILGGHFGGRGGLMPVRQLIEAFLWHWRHGSLPRTATLPRHGEVPIKFADWPGYGFDEWFQLAALYPRFAHAGVLSFIPIDARSQLLPLDIEYATWANPNSEIVYF